MTEPGNDHREDRAIRERYDEYEVGESRVGLISDPENEHAWIWSDGVESAEP